MKAKSFSALTVDDIKECPTWRFTNSSPDDELEIEPVYDRPCTDTRGLIVGCQVGCADGSDVWALLQNVDPFRPERNEHFLTATIDCHDRWFSLARYHDIDVDERGPVALAGVVGKQLVQLFPMSFDIRKEVGFDAPGLVGAIDAEPRTRLSRKEIISLAVSG